MSNALLHSPAKVTQSLLIALGVATDPLTVPLGSWPVYATKELTVPDNCITVYNTSPQNDGRSGPDGERFQHYGIQVRIRSALPDIGYAKAYAIERALNESVLNLGVSLDGSSYIVRCFANTSLLSLGDESPTSKRQLFTVNALVSLKRMS